jgi:hypothetical protein
LYTNFVPNFFGLNDQFIGFNGDIYVTKLIQIFNKLNMTKEYFGWRGVIKLAKELDQVPELQGLAFRRDCKEENANIKLNTMYVRLTITRNKLLENYFARKNWNKNKKIH